MKKKIYRTEITYTVLSEQPLGDVSMQTVINRCDDDDWIGKSSFGEPQELVGKNAVNAMTGMGSDPEFFMMDCDGNDISDEDDISEL